MTVPVPVPVPVPVSVTLPVSVQVPVTVQVKVTVAVTVQVQVTANENPPPPIPATNQRNALRDCLLETAMTDARNGNEWIQVSEKLPDEHRKVALMDCNSYENQPDEVSNPHVVQAGYLTNIHGQQFWSIYGERGLNVNSFTHWMPLPEPPND